ncbi:MAG: hypothetical protein HY903_06745 [Deltaproteobacteria bacterium]|nr:hypothetical protein [Deltaproteobacteria bacterium]
MMLRTLVLVVGVGVAAVGCDGGDDTPARCTNTAALATVFPADGEVAGFTVAAGSTFETASTKNDLVALIDGAADPFTDNGFVTWGRQHYTDGSNTLDYQVYQMPSVAANETTWAAELDPAKSYRQSQVAGGWTDVAGIGDAARVANGGAAVWWYGVRKCAYQVDAHITDLSGTKSDATKTAAETYLKAAVAKIPE